MVGGDQSAQRPVVRENGKARQEAPPKHEEKGAAQDHQGRKELSFFDPGLLQRLVGHVRQIVPRGRGESSQSIGAKGAFASRAVPRISYFRMRTRTGLFELA